MNDLVSVFGGRTVTVKLSTEDLKMYVMIIAKVYIVMTFLFYLFYAFNWCDEITYNFYM